jgi:hypothetical protein
MLSWKNCRSSGWNRWRRVCILNFQLSREEVNAWAVLLRLAQSVHASVQICFAPIYERLRASVWEVGGWSGQWFAPEPQTLHLTFHNSPPFLLLIKRSQSSKQALILPDPLSQPLLPFSQMVEGEARGIPCLGMGAWWVDGWGRLEGQT